MKSSGSSTLPKVTSHLSASGYSKPKGVPHLLQKGRCAIGELAYQSGSDSHRRCSLRILTKAAATPPVARWHILQWQR
jgi:hypothetical protein